MNKQFEPLFEPFKIGNLEIRNRFIEAPMEGTCIIEWTQDTKVNPKAWDYYVERSKNGMGLFIPGLAPLRSMIGGKWLHKHPKVFRDAMPLIDEIHKNGAKVFLQLGAGWGRSFTLNTQMKPLLDNKIARFFGKVALNMDQLMVAPDEGAPNVWLPEYKCRALTVKEIKEFVNAYAQSALLAKNAGFDGVEVHAVHEGYLMDQFTMPYSNHRTDEYGGCFENRYRFAVEVVQAIKALCGKDFPVSLRYSVVSKTKGYNDGAVPGEEFVEAGRDMRESERAIKYLEDAGYDCFNCDNGTYDAWYWAHPPVYMPLNCNLAEAKHIKHFTSKPVFCAGRMQVDAAAEAIAAGELDAVTIGRQFICDGELITKIKEDRMEDIRPCISCHIGCFPVAQFKGGGAEITAAQAKLIGHCALNPRAFEEKKYPVIPAKNPKKISVIGGGIGGMEVAIQAAKRGHKVSLYEKSGELGGVFIAASSFSFKEKDQELIAWYRREINKLPIDVHLNTEVKKLADINADEYVIATGGKPKALPVHGGEKAVFAEDYLRGRTGESGENVAIIGGGITGCEIALELAKAGKKPFIVEMQDDLMKVLEMSAANTNLLRDYMRFYKVPLYLESKLESVNDNSVIILTPVGRKEVVADTVICSIGYNSYVPFKEATDKSKNVHIIGDAKKVSNLKGAIWAANDLVMEMSK